MRDSSAATIVNRWVAESVKAAVKPFIVQEIVVRSTDVDRTLMSAMSNLAGLYPPAGYWKWNANLAWQPIPVHTVPQVEDMLLSSHATCPRYNTHWSETGRM